MITRSNSTSPKGFRRRSLIDQVGGVPAWSKKWYEETGAGLDESRLEVSPGSGPLHDRYCRCEPPYRLQTQP